MNKPNILIVMTDHQRGDTALPEHSAITPSLDRMSQEGITFTNTFCPSPHCCPARATFASGLYPTRHGVWNNICNGQALSRGLREGVRLWSQDLAEAGYEMLWSGKWHVSVEETPKDRGWKELFVTGYLPNEHGTDWEGYRVLAEEPEDTERGESQILRPGYGTYSLYGTLGEGTPSFDKAAVEAYMKTHPELAERAKLWMSKSRDGNPHDEKAFVEAMKVLPDLAKGEKPWALYVGFSGPHDPYYVPKRYLDMYNLEEVPVPSSYADELTDKPRIYQRMRKMRWAQLSEREIREAVRHFWAYCTYLDDLFGQLLAVLDSTGKAENTLVLYCSDHGDYCGDHGLFAKGIPAFRGAYHVPALIRWPSGIKNPGRRIDEFVSLADFAPTFTEVTGGRPDPNLTGKSLVPFFEGRTPENWRDEIHTQCNGVELYYTQRSVMTREYKYVFNGFDNDELYDLSADPDEMKNLAENPDYAEIKHQMVRRMWKFAHREEDTAINRYITVALAPYGPTEAFR